MIDRARSRSLVDRFAECRVLVLGDLMLDRYLWGAADRISPEAPVPVVRVERESTMLGGAGNVVRNLASLGARVDVVALVGDDEAARELERRLDHWKIDAGGLVVDASRPTTEKTRVIARQQIVRFDREAEEPVPRALADQLLEGVRARAPRVDGAVLQDYGKGLLTAEVAGEAIAALREHGVRVFVDPKEPPWSQYRGAELLKPNLREAVDLLRERVRSAADLERVGRAVLEHAGVELVAITQSDRGMTLFPTDGPTRHVATVGRAVADQAGAGDTAVATLALARLAGADWLEAAILANAAGGFVVGIPGTATVTPDELLRVVDAL